MAEQPNPQQEIAFPHQDISYSLKIRKRSKRIRLTIHHDGTLVVTAPPRASAEAIESFIREKRAWIRRNLGVIERLPRIEVPGGAEFFTKHKTMITRQVRQKVMERNLSYQFVLGSVMVKDHKAQWGSCSQKGNLYFNYRIVLLPEHLCDYVIVHELCHLQEFSHSPRFWQLVGQTIPNYRKREKELRSVRFAL